MDPNKKCSKCQVEKPRTEFYTQGKWWMGKCKVCHNTDRAWKDPWGEGKKGCKKCGLVKDLVDFDKEVRNTGSKGKGVASACKACRRPAEKAWREDNAEYVTDYHRGYQRKHRRKLSIGKFVSKTDVAFTVEEYEAMLTTQNGVCKICQGVSSDGRALAIDHCHTTGKVRGLLCNNCNNGLGRFKDDPDLLRSAIFYLEGPA
jgi:hypothetical protein